jgi:hypothetical protein
MALRRFSNAIPFSEDRATLGVCKDVAQWASREDVFQLISTIRGSPSPADDEETGFIRLAGLDSDGLYILREL